MHFLEYYYNNIIKKDLINRFNYKSVKKIPKLEKITVNFGCKSFELKKLASSILSLQLVTTKRGVLTTSKKPNLLLKIRKGNPVGCKLLLTKSLMFEFFTKLITDIIPRIKNKKLLKTNFVINSLTYNIENVLLFKELEKNYLFFNDVKNLQVTFITNTETKEELLFLLDSFKLLLIPT
jgi:large subunit ribosomal protein L5